MCFCVFAETALSPCNAVSLILPHSLPPPPRPPRLCTERATESQISHVTTCDKNVTGGLDTTPGKETANVDSQSPHCRALQPHFIGSSLQSLLTNILREAARASADSHSCGLRCKITFKNLMRNLLYRVTTPPQRTTRPA